jgi:hypothetical protein
VQAMPDAHPEREDQRPQRVLLPAVPELAARASRQS